VGGSGGPHRAPGSSSRSGAPVTLWPGTCLQLRGARA
jgi:hypothetical protein